MDSPLALVDLKRNKKKTAIFVFFAIVVCAGIIILGIDLFEKQEDRIPFYVKVRIIKEADSFVLSSKGPVNVFDVTKTNVLSPLLKLKPGTLVSRTDGKICVAGQKYSNKRIVISPTGKDILGVNKNKYHGEIIVVKDKTGLMAVNRVEIEDYLKGVLPKEVYVFWPFSMLKAQAIASRSFAVFESLRNKNKEYGLTSDTFSQVYAGRSAQNYRTNKAVDKTRGLILEYDNEVLPAFFHSCCGGHTRNAANVWGIDEEPLKGVKCSWCRWSPYFKWKRRIKTVDILARFQEAGYNFDRIDDIRAGKVDKNGFLLFAKIRSKGKWYDVRVQDLRKVLGRSNIKSPKFKIKKYPRFYLFYGYGWGHGVGMCQWGAFGLSLRRWSEERILDHYYPGAKIKPIEEVLKKDS